MKAFNSFIDENKDRCVTFYDELSVCVFFFFKCKICVQTIPADGPNIAIPFESSYNEEGEKVKYLSVIIQHIPANSAKMEKDLEKDLRIANYPEKIEENKVSKMCGK